LTTSGRLFSPGDADSGLRQGDWTGTIRSVFTRVNPLNDSVSIYDNSDWMGDETAPVAFIGSADCTDEFRLRIAQQTKRIGVERNMGPIFLAITIDALQKFSAFFRWLNAHAQNLDFFRDVSFRLVDKGRHLGSTPRSPAATVEEDHSGWRLAEEVRKLDRVAFGVTQLRGGKLLSDIYLNHRFFISGRRI